MKKDLQFTLFIKNLEPYLDKIILFIGSFGFIAFFMFFNNPILNGIAFFDLFTGAIFTIAYLLRKKLSMNLKLMMMYSFLMGFSILSFYTSGLLGSGLIVLAMMILISITFFSRQMALILTSLAIGTLCIFTGLALTGGLNLERYDNSRLHSPSDWVNQTLALIVFAVISFMTVQSIKRMLLEKIKRDEEVNNQLATIAYKDHLTGLPNRLALYKAFADHQGTHSAHKFVVAITEITDYKLMTGTYGLGFAENYLRAIAMEGYNYIKENTKDGYAARIGDNVFAYVVPNWQLDDIDRFFREIAKSLRSNNELLSTLPLQHSCTGYTLWDPMECSFETAFNQCEITLERCKLTHYHGILAYSADFFKEVEEKSRLLAEVDHALSHDEFKIVFQGQWSIEKASFVGLEALSRWENSQNEMIPPSVFIPLINHSSYSLRFNQHIVCKTLSEFTKVKKKWAEENKAGKLTLSINVSPLFFLSNDFTEYLIQVVSSNCLDHNEIILEITEDVFIGDYKEIIRRIDELIAYGFKISLDDFGSGYSSLSHLNSLNVHEIKVDKSIVQKVRDNHKSRILIEMISTMGEKMGCQIVAEGVETKEELELINHLGIDIVQGYYFSKPTRAEELFKE